jgi:hypothetical protein
MFIFNVTQSNFPLTVEFYTHQILLVKTLCPNSSYKYTPFICAPSGDPQGSLVSVQSRWMWGETLGIKGYTSPFYDNPRGCTKP